MGGPYRRDESREQFVARMSRPKLLGNEDLRTRHLLGASYFERVRETVAKARVQICAIHTWDGASRVVNMSGTNTFQFTEEGAGWKISGIVTGLLRFITGNQGKAFTSRL